MEMTKPLVRTGHAVVTIRNPEGEHLTFRVRRRNEWIDRYGERRPGHGYWLDVKEAAGCWQGLAIVDDLGRLRPVTGGLLQASAPVTFAAALVVNGLLAGGSTVTYGRRSYDLLQEDRCGKCGRELRDPVSIERGYGPECYGKKTGSRRKATAA